MSVNTVIVNKVIEGITQYIPIYTSLKVLKISPKDFYKNLSASQKRELQEAKALYKSTSISNSWRARYKYGMKREGRHLDFSLHNDHYPAWTEE